MIDLVVDDAGINAAYFHLERLAFSSSAENTRGRGRNVSHVTTPGMLKQPSKPFSSGPAEMICGLIKVIGSRIPPSASCPNLDDCHSFMHADLRRG